MKTALKALAYMIGCVFVIGFLALGVALVAYVALSLGDLIVIGG